MIAIEQHINVCASSQVQLPIQSRTIGWAWRGYPDEAESADDDGDGDGSIHGTQPALISF